MSEIIYIDRVTGGKKKERVYGGFYLQGLYGDGVLARLFCYLLSVKPFFSKLYGFFQKSHWSRYQIAPFIAKFGVDASEFVLPISAFASFNDFFIRKLKKGVRPIAPGKEVMVMPADGRYLVYPNVSEAPGFWVKGKKFDLKEVLQSEELGCRYEQGAMVLARLCPTDYHRFHFPCDGIPGDPIAINGMLYSVNPIALRKRIEIFAENKRVRTEITTEGWGTICYMEVGATCVGAIHQTFQPGILCAKGEEKGYFSFGGSCLIVLFEPGTITFDADLVSASSQGLEVLGLLGQSLGRKSTNP